MFSMCVNVTRNWYMYMYMCAVHCTCMYMCEYHGSTEHKMQCMSTCTCMLTMQINTHYIHCTLQYQV